MKKNIQTRHRRQEPGSRSRCRQHEVRSYVKRERRRVVARGRGLWTLTASLALRRQAAEVVHFAT
ncbi:DUF6172 family protein [Candidatus Aalborgicola defluviihabitans]|uniref:DUF6172 family protein n=1 Tax=Candidatus Aalborgicola defluviihabitans TaxID=3386187 RepID=UPI0039B91C2D